MKETRELQSVMLRLRDDEELRKRLTDGTNEEGAELFLEIIGLFKASLEEVAYSGLPAGSKETHTKRLNELVGRFLKACRSSSYSGFDFDFDRSLEYVELLSDNLELTHVSVAEETKVASRLEIVRVTNSLIESVGTSRLDELMKRALLVKLQGIRRIAELSSTFDDRELRTQVKLTMADVFAQWETIESQDSSVVNSLKEWSGKVLKGSSRFLGLTADVSEVSGLLPPPGA